MDDTSQLPPDLRAELVAYLDGELDEAATLEMERVLAENSAVRQEVDTLMRTFDLLDELPQQSASEEFTETTLATIQIESASGPRAATPWYKRVPRGLVVAGWMTSLALSAVFGVLLSQPGSDDESQLLVEELPLLENLDVYTELGGIEYLEKLRESGLFDDTEQSQQP